VSTTLVWFHLVIQLRWPTYRFSGGQKSFGSHTFLLKRFRTVAKSATVFMFVRPYVRNISAALNRQIYVEFHIGDFYVNCRENQNLDKTGERSKWNFIFRPTYVLFLLAKLNRYTIAPFE